eukprot:Rhum_TRINITY_DN25185_c0_g1::Rhum_TRINITY_DN25185_c0_g1_i1::g.181457::m.181457
MAAPYPYCLYVQRNEDAATSPLPGVTLPQPKAVTYPSALWAAPPSKPSYPAALYRERARRSLWHRARLGATAVARWNSTRRGRLNIYNQEWHHEEGAASTIQRMFRIQRARLQQEDKHLWAAFKSIDEAEEQHTVRRIDQMKQLQAVLCDVAGMSISNMGASLALPAVGPSAFPCPTSASILEMMRGFRAGQVLPITDATSLVQAATLMFAQEATVVHVESEGDVTVVCGDIHGSLHDLLHVLDTYGMPGSGLKYVFNGDLVDRGDNSCEVLLIVLALKLCAPDAVFVNRGNHEDTEVNVFYGFVDECREKYDFSFYQLCAGLFDYLPLVTILNKSVCVLHGGLSSVDNFLLSEVASFNRGPDYCTRRSERQETIIGDILWSDPKKSDTSTGISPSPRGRGQLFGRDVTERFLRENDLKLLVRSHEEQQTGYRVQHKGMLVTVFSVSNYAGHGNGAALLVFDAGSHKPRVHKWSRTVKDKRRKNEQSKVEMMAQYVEETVTEKQSHLLAYWSSIDSEKKGIVSYEDWSRGLDVELNMAHLPPSVRSQMLKGVESEDGQWVNYRKFLNVFHDKYYNRLAAFGNVLKWHSEAVNELAEHIGKSTEDIERAFAAYDTSHTGWLSFDEMKAAIRKVVGLEVLSDHQLDTLALAFDTSGDGQISKEEFVAKLTGGTPGKPHMHLEWTCDRRQEKLKELRGQLSLHGKAGVEEALRKYDVNGDGRMCRDELATVLKTEFSVNLGGQTFVDLLGILGGDDNTTEDALKAATKSQFPVASVSIRRYEVNRKDAVMFWGAFVEYVVHVVPTTGEPWEERHRFKSFESLGAEMGKKAPAGLPSGLLPVWSEEGRERRMRGLEKWLQRALSDARGSKAVRDSLRVFLRVPYRMSSAAAERGSKTIDIEALAAALCPPPSSVRRTSAAEVTPALGASLLALLYKYRNELKHVFHTADQNGTGSIAVEDFRQTLLSLNELEGHPMTLQQLDKLVQTVDANKDGVVDYKEFENAVGKAK